MVRGLLEDALVMTRLLNNRCSRSVNVADLGRDDSDRDVLDLSHCPTYGQLCSSKLLGLNQLLVGSPRWTSGGCCTAVVVSLGMLPLHRMVGYIFVREFN